MIGKTLQSLLTEKNINVNELSKMINVSNQTLYSIIKRDNMKIDFEILLKICKALNVNVDYFYSDYTDLDKTTKHTDNKKINEFINLCSQLSDDELDIVENLVNSLLDKHDKDN